jgi:hypothetical protein
MARVLLEPMMRRFCVFARFKFSGRSFWLTLLARGIWSTPRARFGYARFTVQYMFNHATLALFSGFCHTILKYTSPRQGLPRRDILLQRDWGQAQHVCAGHARGVLRHPLPEGTPRPISGGRAARYVRATHTPGCVHCSFPGIKSLGTTVGIWGRGMGFGLLAAGYSI